MNLILVTYKNSNRWLLYIGEVNNKIIALDNNHIQNKELQIIKQYHLQLDTLPLKDKIRWFKENTPISYKGDRKHKTALRTLDKKYSATLKTISIPKPLQAN